MVKHRKYRNKFRKNRRNSTICTGKNPNRKIGKRKPGREIKQEIDAYFEELD